MLVDLVPQFLAVLDDRDPPEAYRRYLDEHAPVLRAYWYNYILDPDGPHAAEVVRRAVQADRHDLRALLKETDVAALAEEMIRRCEDALEVDEPFDVYLMIGVGGANAGELVVGGRGIAFVCLEHFTGRANPESLGLGLSPQLLRPWIAHEIAHTVRYTSPASRSELARIVRTMNGYYDCWEAGSRAALRELLVNEGLAVAAARQVAPGFEPWEYLGYSRRVYRRLRQLEAFLTQAVRPELDERGLGFRLRYLAGGVPAAQRLVSGKVVPERSGYYLGWRMVEHAVERHGIAAALRTPADECESMEEPQEGAQTA
jgi:hypothetical protein